MERGAIMIQGAINNVGEGERGHSLDDMWFIGILKHLLVAP